MLTATTQGTSQSSEFNNNIYIKVILIILALLILIMVVLMVCIARYFVKRNHLRVKRGDNLKNTRSKKVLLWCCCICDDVNVILEVDGSLNPINREAADDIEMREFEIQPEPPQDINTIINSFSESQTYAQETDQYNSNHNRTVDNHPVGELSSLEICQGVNKPDNSRPKSLRQQHSQPGYNRSISEPNAQPDRRISEEVDHGNNLRYSSSASYRSVAVNTVNTEEQIKQQSHNNFKQKESKPVPRNHPLNSTEREQSLQSRPLPETPIAKSLVVNISTQTVKPEHPSIETQTDNNMPYFDLDHYSAIGKTVGAGGINSIRPGYIPNRNNAYRLQHDGINNIRENRNGNTEGDSELAEEALKSIAIKPCYKNDEEAKDVLHNAIEPRDHTDLQVDGM